MTFLLELNKSEWPLYFIHMAGVKKGASEEIWTAGLHVHKIQKREPHRGMFGSIRPVQQIPLTCKRAVVEPAQMDGSMVKNLS